MNAEDTRTIVLQALRRVAPESDPEHLDPDVPFRDQMDFDSVDFVNLMELLQQATGRRIPETDYPCLGTLNGCISYLG